MELDSIHRVYLLGIGGIGMSALARYFLSKGLEVSGYDRSPSPITDALINEGAQIVFDDEVSTIDMCLLDDDSLLIYTPAIPSNNKIYQFLLNSGIHLYKRSEILGKLSQDYQCIGIAGTHGKTTVSSMAAHILNTSPQGCQAFLGGITKNYESNLITHPSSNWMVVEADEFDRSFLQLFPQIALITSIDADHLDIYGTHSNLIKAFQQYANQIKDNGKLIIKHLLAKQFKHNLNTYTYDLSDPNADFYAYNIQLINHKYQFSLHYPKGEIENITMSMPGLLNLENAVAASSTAILAGVDDNSIKTALESFKGIKRRMEQILKNDNIIFYDDYAHHPEEIKASILSIKALYPDKELTVVFQPHLFSRTKDFAKDFAHSLDLAKHIILLNIYPAREKAIEGITSKTIMQYMKNTSCSIQSKENLASFLKSRKPSLLLSLGAGDIDRLIEPIKTIFL